MLFASGTVLQSHLPPHCEPILKSMMKNIQRDTEEEIKRKAQAQRTEAQYAMLVNNLRARQMEQQRQLLQMQQQTNLNAYTQMLGAILAMTFDGLVTE
jgi:hypothetical protein